MREVAPLLRIAQRGFSSVSGMSSLSVMAMTGVRASSVEVTTVPPSTLTMWKRARPFSSLAVRTSGCASAVGASLSPRGAGERRNQFCAAMAASVGVISRARRRPGKTRRTARMEKTNCRKGVRLNMANGQNLAMVCRIGVCSQDRQPRKSKSCLASQAMDSK